MCKSMQVPQIDTFEEAVSMYLNKMSEDRIKKSDYHSTYKKRLIYSIIISPNAPHIKKNG